MAHRTAGQGDQPRRGGGVADPGSGGVLVVHGAGSAPNVAVAAFPTSLATSFWLAGHGPVGGPADDDGRTDRLVLADLVETLRPTLVAGISYGAHQVARWASTGVPSCVRALALIMPAWTGPADGQLPALATAAQADAFADVGVAAELGRITVAYPGWVSDALAASWPRHRPAEIEAALRAVAMSHGPDLGELGLIDLPTAVVGIPDDPLHPTAVAAGWAAALPDGRLGIVTPAGLADLGACALRLLGETAA